MFFILSEQVDTRESGSVENINSDEILMICDSTAHRFTMENCQAIVLEEDVGLEELLHMINPGLHGGTLSHDISQFKLLILMIGGGDFNIPTILFRIKWYALMEIIRQFHPDVNVLVTPPLSSPDDSVDMRVKAEERSEFLSYYAHDHLQVQFTRPQEEFWFKLRPTELYFDNFGNLTELGLAEIRSQLIHKIALFRLLDN